MVNYIPKRGDFIRLTFNPQAGHEQKGDRPALVLSRDKFNLKMGFIFIYTLLKHNKKWDYFDITHSHNKLCLIL